MEYGNTLVYRNGHLCVTSAYSLSDEPTIIRHFWSFGQEPLSRLPELIVENLDKPLWKEHGCFETYRVGDGLRSMTLRLPEGGQTKAIEVIHEPIPAPKVRKGIELRYYSGRWQKYSKRDGWITA